MENQFIEFKQKDSTFRAKHRVNFIASVHPDVCSMCWFLSSSHAIRTL